MQVLTMRKALEIEGHETTWDQVGLKYTAKSRITDEAEAYRATCKTHDENINLRKQLHM